MKKKPEQNRPDSRFIIGIGGGHREYDIINTRYVVAAAASPHSDDQRTTHRTARCNYWYINRMVGSDVFGSTPDFAARTDLVDRGRVGPARAQDPRRAPA